MSEKESNPVGRPVKYKTPEAMQVDIDAYFDSDAWLKQGDDVIFCPTVSGIAYALNMTTASFRNYEKRDEFFSTIKRAKQKVEITLEQRLSGNSVTGSIFNLKHNFSWKDKHEEEQGKTDMADVLKALVDKLPD